MSNDYALALGLPKIYENYQTPGGQVGVSCGRSVLALHLKRLFDNAGLPTTKPRDSAP
jgi:hypothetical protein